MCAHQSPHLDQRLILTNEANPKINSTLQVENTNSPTCQNCLSQNNCPMLFIALYFCILPLSLYSIMIKGDNKVTKESTF
jgi:hypothetical protein